MKFTGYTPYLHQNAVHEAISKHIEQNKRFTDSFQKVFTVLSCRQVGKSLMAYNELLRFAINFNRSKNYYIAPTFSLCQKSYDEILAAIIESGIVSHKNASRRNITLINGSTIRFMSAEQGDAARGETCTGIMVIDEAYFIRDDFYNNVASPFVIAKKALTLLISTPRFKTGFFYDSYIKGMESNKLYQSFSFMNYDLSHIISSEKLEDIRRNVPTTTFKSEYLGQFLDSDAMVFGNVKSVCVVDMGKIPDNKHISIGIDWGTGNGNDETVICGFNESGTMILLYRIKEMEPVKQIDVISEIIKSYPKVMSITAEMNSIGAVYYDILKRKVNKKIRKFVTTNTTKREAIEKFQVAIQTEKVQLFNDEELINQFTLFEQNVNEVTKTVRYGAPIGLHDDIVMACVIGWDGYLKSKSSPYIKLT